VALGITLLAVPSEGSAPPAISASFKAALVEQNPKLLLISLIGFTATFTTVSFIGPIITAVTSLEGAAIGAVQISTGVGSLLGLSAGAYLARFPLRYSLAFCMTVAAITQAAFSLGMFNDLGVLAIPSVIAIIIFGSGAMFATNPIVQTELARSSGPAATIAFALNSSMIYLGQGLGAVCGGLVIAFGSLSWTGFAGAVLAVFATMAVASIKRRPQGQSVRS
ncbi:MAG: MFS transporter, partial [Pseudomonadota bacterium]